MRRILTAKKSWLSLVMAGVIVIVARTYVLPWVVKERVKTGLAEVGIESIDDLTIEYALGDLWNGRIDHLVMRGGRFVIRNEKGSIRLGMIGARTEKSAKPQGATTTAFPVRSVGVQGAKVVFASGPESIEVSVSGTMIANGSVLDIKLSGDEGNAQIDGRWDIATNEAEVHATVDTAAANKGLDAAAVLKSASGIDKLSVHKGVFHIDGKLGKNGTSVTVRLDGLELQESGNDLVVEGANGTVELTSLAPLATAGEQTLTVSRVKVGETELADGSVTFRVEQGAALIRETKWKWLGGEVAAHDFRFASGEPVRVMLEAHELSLKELLATFAQGKVEGNGKLSGQLPLEITSAGVKFGEGALGALGTGELKIVDASLTEPVAAAAAKSIGQASQERVKQNIVEALKNFRFNRLTAKLQQEPEGLVAYVSLSGKGTTGAHQGLDYDLRITGLSELLESVLKIRARMQRMGK